MQRTGGAVIVSVVRTRSARRSSLWSVIARTNVNTPGHTLLAEWLLRIRHAQVAHIKATGYYERLNLWLGIPVVLLTTLVGTSVFATLQQDAGAWVKVIA